MTFAATALDTTEKRSVSRHRVLLAAKLVYGNHAFTPECMIRNLTDRGCSIRLAEGLSLPPVVSLIDMGAGHAYGCHVVWRRSGFAGLAFTSVRDLATAGPGDPLRKLWVDALPRGR